MHFCITTSHFRCLFIIIIFFGVQVSCCIDDPKYVSCANAFECGKVKNITYPFWGNGRPEYCGHRDFELKCQEESVYIEIQSQNYTVSAIDEVKRTLSVFPAKNNYTNICPSQFFNISIQFDLFHISTPSTQTLTLFYSCPSIPQLITNRFDCSVNGNNSNNYFLVNDNMGVISEAPPECQFIVKVHVLQRVLVDKFSSYSGYQSNPTRTAVTLKDLLAYGFVVGYVMDITVCKECKNSGRRCGYELHSVQPTCYCYDGQYPKSCAAGVKHPSHSKKCGTGNVKVIVGIVASVGGTLVIAAAVGIIIFCRLRKKKMKNLDNLEAFLKTHGALALRRYKYSDVKKMTDSFQDKLGQGGFGSVYKGKLLDGRMVAVKVLNETKGNGNEFINEVASISRTSHVNIVGLLGFCVEGSKRALIYEYVPNGSLEKFIYVENPLEADSHLGWETLYKIAIGIAYGLEYLHRGCYIRILHFDIKPHNILLDEEFNPKISDFGLAKLCVGKDSMVSMTGARGTAGYIAPEVVSRNFGGVSHKADVYSYGMMLLEMVGGRKNLNVRVTNLSEIYFPQWIYKRLDLNEDLGLYGVTTVEEEEIARKMILVGLWCIQMDPSDRPAMSKVLEMLEGSLQAVQIPPKPFVSSPAKEQGNSSTTSIS